MIKTGGCRSDRVDVDRELTSLQARDIARLRRRHPDAELRVHQRSWGVVIEVRRGTRTVAVERFAFGDAPVAPVVDLAA